MGADDIFVYLLVALFIGVCALGVWNSRQGAVAADQSEQQHEPAGKPAQERREPSARTPRTAPAKAGGQSKRARRT
jgi:hypothetical protein